MTATRRQKLLGMFPDWRLKKVVKNASDEELEDSAEACEWWGWRGAMILMGGLIAEVILTAIELPHESLVGRWGVYVRDSPSCTRCRTRSPVRQDGLQAH